jgi:hypothetical protein
VSLVLVAPAIKADTIHLKNGSVIKGKVASFADDQFVVVLDTGSARFVSRAMIYVADVARIEFDSAPAPAVGTEPTTARDTSTPVQPRETAPSEAAPATGKPAETQPRETAPPEPQPTAPPTRETIKQPETPRVEPPAAAPSTPTTPAESPETAAPKKPAGPVKTVSVDVAAKRDWTSTGLIVKRGDRIRISASGSVTLDPASNQTSGPEGTEIADARKLMPDRPTGALIAVIGADNDDFIFIGRAAEFSAARDGLLFLSVNEGVLSDNTGSYKATIEVQSQTPARRP